MCAVDGSIQKFSIKWYKRYSGSGVYILRKGGGKCK